MFLSFNGPRFHEEPHKKSQPGIIGEELRNALGIGQYGNFDNRVFSFSSNLILNYVKYFALKCFNLLKNQVYHLGYTEWDKRALSLAILPVIKQSLQQAIDKSPQYVFRAIEKSTLKFIVSDENTASKHTEDDDDHECKP